VTTDRRGCLSSASGTLNVILLLAYSQFLDSFPRRQTAGVKGSLQRIAFCVDVFTPTQRSCWLADASLQAAAAGDDVQLSSSSTDSLQHNTRSFDVNTNMISGGSDRRLDQQAQSTCSPCSWLQFQPHLGIWFPENIISIARRWRIKKWLHINLLVNNQENDCWL